MSSIHSSIPTLPDIHRDKNAVSFRHSFQSFLMHIEYKDMFLIFFLLHTLIKSRLPNGLSGWH